MNSSFFEFEFINSIIYDYEFEYSIIKSFEASKIFKNSDLDKNKLKIEKWEKEFDEKLFENSLLEKNNK